MKITIFLPHENYPYTVVSSYACASQIDLRLFAQDETKCNFNKTNVGAAMSSCQYIKADSEADLLDAVEHIGPISVAIDASHISFQVSLDVIDECVTELK